VKLYSINSIILHVGVARRLIRLMSWWRHRVVWFPLTGW